MNREKIRKGKVYRDGRKWNREKRVRKWIDEEETIGKGKRVK